MKKKTTAGASVGTILLVVAVVVIRALTSPDGGSSPDAADTGDRQPPAGVTREPEPRAPAASGASPATHDTASAHESDDALIERLFREERSDEIVTAAGRVSKTLPDDNEGSRHQRFIVELASGRTVLVAHNIDLAPRVPLREGDRVIVHGEYEWSQRGGTVHWTHHDPKGWREGGWIEHAGERYE